MRVGIYAGVTFPKAGGEFTLLSTVIRDVVVSACPYELIVFIEDEARPSRIREDNILYVNLIEPPSLLFRIRRKILRWLRYYREPVLNDFFDKVLWREKIDLLWLLKPYNLDLSVPYVFTVWDLGHRMLPCFPEVGLPAEWKMRETMYQKMLLRATYIITGNEVGKQEILANYPINADKIKIIPFPISSFCFEKLAVPADLGNIKKPFVFYPAQFWAHKNHVALVEAIAWLRDKKKTIINCYFVGSEKNNLNQVKYAIKKHNLENQVFILGFVEYAELRYLYQNALAMVYISLMGPNNLPPLEAIALGCPVIISNIPGHIEQMGKAGLFVNAFVPQDIGRAILTLYKNPKRCRELISNGLILAKKYKNYSYFQEMLRVIEQYALQYKTWAV
ncbi:glycosyl transferase group 1 [Candidatus Termititenax persephonae]|uniref:Glycosyl transferase group 1 n=1 Tax=Candidatus Termititenax persephonae TaxID=2218525 RepID=A0A388TFT9_9BACT|nr:glycosyl transferase group 1 [Candidatus Termititenax persephonae]